MSAQPRTRKHPPTKRFDLLQALDAGSAETWSMNQHRQDIQPGDRVWFRITVSAAGIYAVGRVASLPRKESDEFGDWHADVTFESRVNPPLLRAESEPSDTFDNRHGRRGELF